jgi:hypothetical protein
MTRNEIGNLSFKILSVYAIISAIEKVPAILRLLYLSDLKGPKILNLFSGVIPPVLLVLCGIVLWFSAPALTSLALGARLPEEKPSATSAEIQGIAFSVIGMYVLANALPNLVQSAVFYYYIVSSGEEGGAPFGGTIIVLLFQLALGLWLLLGFRRIVSWIRSIQ